MRDARGLLASRHVLAAGGILRYPSAVFSVFQRVDQAMLRRAPRALIEAELPVGTDLNVSKR